MEWPAHFIHQPLRDDGDFHVVGIGASAGGLDACGNFLSALPADTGATFILVQHLDPTHQSMMVKLLTAHTPMTVRQATDGMPLERNHLYVIPPGAFLSVRNDALHLSQPQLNHGVRLPFDLLLHSLAEAYGPRAVCVILSGDGSDGSVGLKAVKEKGGLVIVQDPDEASHDGMPRSAIMTGLADLVLPAAKIPMALLDHVRRPALARPRGGSARQNNLPDLLPKFLALLREKTTHDFGAYKQGTLRRRIEQRMATMGSKADNAERYLELLRTDPQELERLVQALFINVTSFFRDRKSVDLLARTIIPEMVAGQGTDRPLRVWVPGCSTGEEAYSLAMLFLEHAAAIGREANVQIFASDVDPDAVAKARDIIYPKTIEADVSSERLARFFVKEDRGYRVSRELREAVIFTVHDVLTDPPFSRLDMISCQNLLIYLSPEAQANVIARFHFALLEGGILVLGNTETVGTENSHFELIDEPERIYRHIDRSTPGEVILSMGASGDVRPPAPAKEARARSRQAALADLCQRMVLENYAPAAVLIDSAYECLYFLGSTDRYLHVEPGQASHNLLAKAHIGMRTKLNLAIQRAFRENARVVISGVRIDREDRAPSFSIAAQPVLHEGTTLLLVCFIDEPRHDDRRDHPAGIQDPSRISQLEHELEVTKLELENAVRNLEASSKDQTALRNEILSINEEHQTTNEELLTSKEELQSINEELTALNSHLQETLDRQRTISNDLRNILYSTEVATIILDTDLTIRFYTPVTKSLFHIIPGDVGRPLADLSMLAAEYDFLADARIVLQSNKLIEREFRTRNGNWYTTRISPYHTEDGVVEGVVISFSDTTERKRASDAIEMAKQQAQLANDAKSRFLAAASHDLRQPLQTLTLLQGLLVKVVKGTPALALVARLDETLGVMSGILNTLLGIGQIEGGTVRAKMIDFPIDDLLGELRAEFAFHAQAKGLALHTVSCSLSVHSDPDLLGQMIRNLLANAIKYTRRGKVLLGCRRRKGILSIEVWDTGVGIPEVELQAIFEEYHQLDNSARERDRGLGLGLSIVQRLGILLDHRVRVRSQPGKGSVFSIEVALSPKGTRIPHERHRPNVDEAIPAPTHHTGAILIVEDDPDVRELLAMLLKDEGHFVAAAPDGAAALDLVGRGKIRPDIILADYNLPNGMNGLQVTAKVRQKLQRQIPVIILTGDISTDALREIARHDYVQLDKPVRSAQLTQAIQHLLPISQSAAEARAPTPAETAVDSQPPVIVLVDDDSHIRDAMSAFLKEEGFTVDAYSSAEALLEAYRPGRGACFLIDVRLPGMSGVELLGRIRDAGHRVPAIMMTGYSDISMAVQAMKAGASDFIEKPASHSELLGSIKHAIQQSQDSTIRLARQEKAANAVANLTLRQRQIMELILAGHPNKNIAADLGISQRTVENHRAAIMEKTGAKSLPALARLALAAGSIGTSE